MADLVFQEFRMPTDSAVGEGRKPNSNATTPGRSMILSVTRFVAVDTTTRLALVQSSCVEKLMKLAIPSFDVAGQPRVQIVREQGENIDLPGLIFLTGNNQLND